VTTAFLSSFPTTTLRSQIGLVLLSQIGFASDGWPTELVCVSLGVQARQGSGLACRMPGFVEITCSNAAEFRTMPPAEFKTMIGLLKAASERVERGEMTRAAFEAMEVSIGHHVNPHGIVDSALLLDHIRWPDVVCYDWVHCMLQGGVLNDEAEALLAASSVAGVTREGLQRFLAD